MPNYDKIHPRLQEQMREEITREEAVKAAERILEEVGKRNKDRNQHFDARHRVSLAADSQMVYLEDGSTDEEVATNDMLEQVVDYLSILHDKAARLPMVDARRSAIDFVESQIETMLADIAKLDSSEHRERSSLTRLQERLEHFQHVKAWLEVEQDEYQRSLG